MALFLYNKVGMFVNNKKKSSAGFYVERKLFGYCTIKDLC